MRFDTIAEIGLTQGELLAIIGTAASAAIVAFVRSLLRAPGKIKSLEDTLKVEQSRTKALFLKARTYEDWILEHEVREGRPTPRRISENRRTDSDARDGFSEGHDDT